MEGGYHQPVIEVARIVNVNVNDYTVDTVAEYGNRRAFDIQVMSPYFHFFNGEGWYAMPEIGALCWVCQESPGLFGRQFVLGYMAPHDERLEANTGLQADNYRANRQILNPGDMMWRGRDENFVVLRRGGVVQVGSSPANQRMYIPLGSIIRDFCFGYELFSLAGELKFETDSVNVVGTEVAQADDAGDVKTRFILKTKTQADEPEHAVILTAGSHKDDDNLRLSLEIRPSGAEGEAPVLELQVDKSGNVNWTHSGSFGLSSVGDVSLTSETGNAELISAAGNTTVRAKQNLQLQAEAGKASLLGSSAVDIGSSGPVTVAGSSINLAAPTQVGGPGGEPIVKGTQLKLFLQEPIKGMTDPAAPFGPIYAPGQPILFPGMTVLNLLLENMFSENTTT
jgi:hypothetical protein